MSVHANQPMIRIDQPNIRINHSDFYYYYYYYHYHSVAHEPPNAARRFATRVAHKVG